MSRWLGQNISLILVSFVLAFFFWAIATESNDPTREGPFPASIPVETEGLGEDKMAYGIQGSRVRVELRAPESVWASLEADDLRAYIDLSEVSTGTLTLPIQVEAQASPVQLLKVTPAEATLSVEFIAEKELTVTVKSEGTPVFGYRAETPEVLPQTVRVRGPASLVEKVTQAQVTVSLDGQLSDAKTDLSPVLLDESGNLVPNVEVIPKTVTVHVPIWQSEYVRNLAVILSLVGQPSPGYRVAGVTYTPQVVTVYGRRDLVESAPAYLRTTIIKLDGMTQSLTTTVGLQMPAGLYVISQPRSVVTASLSIEVIQSGLNLEVRPVIYGLSQSMTATVEIETVALILSGPLAVMEELNIDDVQILLDVTGMLPGEYTIIPDVTVPNEVTIESIIPEAISVTIERAVSVEQPFR